MVAAEMAVLLDSNVIIAMLNSRDKNHSRAGELLTKLKQPEYGMRITIDYVLDEVLTTLWNHTHRRSIVEKAYNLICSRPDFIKFSQVGFDVLDIAWETWMKFASWPEKPFSFTDCCIIAFMDKNDIEHLATYDSDFDGLVSIISNR
ncbi:MAG: PIN domain-containing protein [Candidatus Lokiarchaeota archaeon]|nr:PIN domain-containing protein [Candidatus Lokiarchaeota archaeon]